MGPEEIYAKTEAGALELKQRTRSLPVTLRSLLIMVDGKRTVAQLLDHARALRVDVGALAELERAGLIAKRFDAPSRVADDAGPVARSEEEVKRFLAAQRILNDAIGEHLGFRGYVMMLRLQRAENLRDLRDLLPDFAQALVKRIGVPAASPLVTRLEQLIAAPGASAASGA